MQPLVAPSAAVPTSRPSKRPLKRRPQSIRPGGKKRPKEPKQDESHPTKTGGVRELMRFLPQSPNQDRDRDMPLCSPTSSTFSWSSSSSAASTATTSAREMLRAGQRRLRRLAQARARAKTSSSSDDESLVREQMERPLEPPALASWRDGDRRPTVAAVEPSTPPSRDGDKLRGDSGDHQERRCQGDAPRPISSPGSQHAPTCSWRPHVCRRARRAGAPSACDGLQALFLLHFAARPLSPVFLVRRRRPS